jgi:iron complex transport system ATP-binding protein
MEKPAPLTAKDLHLGYRKGKLTHEVAAGISFELQTGELTCLLGPNGVGKSTLLRTIMGVLPPISGDLIIEGKNIQTYTKEALSRKLSVVLTDRIQVGNLRAGELIALGRIPHTGWMGSLQEKDLLKINEPILATKTAYLQDIPVHELSDGQLQKVMIARALAQDGEIMLLDEPTAHLDLVNRYEIMLLLRQVARASKKAVLVVTHDLEIALESADKLLLMPCGQAILSGVPEDLVIQGKMDLLLPTGKLYFHKKTGKIKTVMPFQPVDVSGPEELIPWVVSALEKSEFPLNNVSVQIRLEADPFRIFAVIDGFEITFESVHQFVIWLLERGTKRT